MGAQGTQPRDIARRFPGAVQKALEETVKELDEEFRTQIKSVDWKWKGTSHETYRKVRPAVTEPRDIVDTRALLASQTKPKQTSKYSFLIKWEVNYSAIVHDGGTLKDGKTYYPDRPWTKRAEDKVKPLGYFADILRRELNG